MSTLNTDGFTEEAVEGLRHLLALVQEHELAYADPASRGDLTVSWEPPPSGLPPGPNGWWLSVIMPGHYAYEKDCQPSLPTLIADAVAYYSQPTCVWDSSGTSKGCPRLHPYTGYNVQLV